METIKLSFIGRSDIGRSCLLYRFINKKFNNDLMATKAYNYYTSSMKMNNGKEIKLILYDHSEQERFESLTRNFLSLADGVIIHIENLFKL